MIRLPQGVFIPERIAHEPLHRPDFAAFHLEGHGFDRFAFQGTELAHPIIKKLVPRFLPGKTRAKGGVEPTKFVHERINITPGECKLGNSKRLPSRPTRR
jgi:hypothetical protein